ncbi:MAG: CmcJ/NvfI family oxidoreductase [Candidatus Binataceae bacterium]
MENITSVDERDSASAVRAPFNYLAVMAAKPYNYTYTPLDGAPLTNRRVAKETVVVRNGRDNAERLTLDREGFAFLRYPSTMRDFYDDGEVRAVYYPECERLLREATGAARVVVFDHIVRNAARSKAGEKAIKQPAAGVHNDYTLNSAPQRVRDFFPDTAGALLQSRFAIINVWRPISGPVRESPLAVCDAQSLRLDDFVASDLIYPNRRGETYAVNYSPRHRWYYFPRMMPEEALLLKCYDTSEDGRARFTAHTAFIDPNSPPDAPARESIETRAFVFFAPSN